MPGGDQRDRPGRNRLVVSICGPSGSGKSSLALQVVERLGHAWASRIPADWYLLDYHPGSSSGGGYAWDWSRLIADLRGPDGQQAQTPSFDFTRMRRGPAGSVKVFTLRPVMVIDAMVPCPAADLVIRLEVSAEERQRRLAERDARWGTRVLERWDSLEASFPALSPLPADLVLDGQRPSGALTLAVLDAMRQRFTGELPDPLRGHRLDALP